MTCTHAIREGQGYSDNFEIVGSHSDDAWGRCKTCGTWWWCIIDQGKFQYEASWLIPTDLAEPALLRHDPDALAQLFVTCNLPHGPMWEWSASLIEIVRALTPGSTDAIRALALERAGAKGEWEQAIRTMRLDASASVPKKELAFEVDLRVPNVQFREWFEVGDALVLLSEGSELFRLERRGLVQLPLGAKPSVLAHQSERILLGVGPGWVVLDAAGQATSGMLQGDYAVTALDDGWWLFVPKTSERDRFIEFHVPDGRGKVKLKRRFGENGDWMPPPRRFAGGWLVSNLVDDEGAVQALTLFDDAFRTVAYSTGIDGERSVTPSNPESFWASCGDTMERWVRTGKALDRTHTFESRTSLVVRDRLITDTREGDVVARGMDGKYLWSWKRATDGATYGVGARDNILFYDNTSAHWLDADGKLKRTFRVESPHVRVGRAGTIYMKTGAELFVIGDNVTEIVVGSDSRIETTCGDRVLLRNGAGGWMLVGPAGVERTFAAQGARFSVIGTSSLWVVERNRIRGTFPPERTDDR
jgi:hypothetical protein